MSVQAISWVLDHSKSRLAARHVLISIANHAKSDGTGAWPSVGTIAREARVSKREVQRSIPQLIGMGELSMERGAGPNGTHLYALPRMGATNCHRGMTNCQGEGVTNGRVPPDQLSPEPSLTVLKPKKSLSGFDDFWKLYPKKVAKQDALRAWKVVEPHEVPAILNAVSVATSTEQWQRDGGKFIPHAATWLRGRRWEDEVGNSTARPQNEYPIARPDDD